MFSVLIADDEEIIRLDLRRMVAWEKMGFHIEVEAVNGYDALEKLGDRHIDLLVSDIKMPKIDGLELYRELKDKGQCSCAVFLSGHSEFEYVRPALVLGALDYILKPFEPSKVLDVLSRAHQFLEDKYKELEEKNILLNTVKNNNLFYPVESERKLLSLILQGDTAASSFIEEVIREREKLRYEVESISQMAAMLISNVKRSILQQYTYLENIYDAFELGNVPEIKGTNLDEVILAAKKSVNDILGIIKCFKLNQKDNIVAKACEYVLEKVESDITLKEVSEHFFISRNYFCSLFKKETGENFLEYVTKAKMERAKILLKENNYKAYEVSTILGYKETSYFSKLFKKYTGYSPTEYRKHVAENTNSNKKY